jgi:hypothetical protein
MTAKGARNFWKQRALIVYVGALILGASKRRVTSPLVSDNSVIHCPAEDIQDFHIEEKLRGEARPLKRHGDQMK